MEAINNSRTKPKMRDANVSKEIVEADLNKLTKNLYKITVAAHIYTPKTPTITTMSDLYYPAQHPLAAHIKNAIQAAGGWLAFDAFMTHALYAPQLGYYARNNIKLGLSAADGSDFATAPEISPLFGYTLAAQIADALQHTNTHTIYEFGAGSGALAKQLLEALAQRQHTVQNYYIVELSSSLRARQQARLKHFGKTVQWLHSLPETLCGVVIGNEVLDAMPVQLLVRKNQIWHERGISVNVNASNSDGFAFTWSDQPTHLRPPVDIADTHDYLTEIHPQAESFIRTIAERLTQGAAFFIDYGFDERSYYHTQRSMGTLVCHHQHKVDSNPLHQVGEKDITAHINFTGIALTAQQAGMELLGYCSQGRFLINCGMVQHMENADLPTRSMAAKLMLEHEMGELFKVLGFCKGSDWGALGFAQGNRLYSL